MRAIGLALLLCLGASPQTASFEGTAVNATNGEPLIGVHISLIGFSLRGVRDSYGAMSDAKGHFSVGNVPAGTYILLVERRGFIRVETKKKGALPLPTLVFKPGERVADFKLALTPRAVISGRVVDDFGDPVPNADVKAVPTDDAQVALNLGPDDTTTDDHGEFRLSREPGKFHLQVIPPDHADGVEIRTDGSSPVVYATTWYPNTAAPEQAAAVETTVGAEVSGLEIHLAHKARQEPARSTTISGVVQGFPGDSAQEHVLISLARTVRDGFQDAVGFGVKPDGSFALHVSAGTYRIWATYRGGRAYLQSDPLELAVSSDVTGLLLTLQPAGDLTGTVEIAGERAATPKPKRTVRFGEWSADTDRDGIYRLNAVRPGRYKVEIDPLPEDGYIQSTVLDGAAHDGDWLDLPRGVHGSTLKIAVAAGARISGAVLNTDGTRAVNALAIVTLEPVDPKAEAPSDNMARVDDAANYRFHNLRPGRYRIAAYDFLKSMADNPDAMKNASGKGEEIEVKAGDRLTKDLTVMEPADAKK